MQHNKVDHLCPCIGSLHYCSHFVEGRPYSMTAHKRRILSWFVFPNIYLIGGIDVIEILAYESYQ